MPEPKDGETEEDFVKRCIPVVIADNTAKDGEQAAAICHSLFKQAQEDSGKAGRVLARRNVERLQRAWQEIRQIFADAGVDLDAAPEKEPPDEDDEGDGKVASLEARAAQVRRAFDTQYGGDGGSLWVREVYADAVVVESSEGLYSYSYVELDGKFTFGEPVRVELQYVPVKTAGQPVAVFWKGQPLTPSDEMLVAIGGQLKALSTPEGGTVRVGGQLVLFGSEQQKDFDGEWFSADTYYGPNDGNGADVLVHHGQPLRAELKDLAGRVLGPLKVVRNELGLFAETVLHLADEYEKMLYELIEAGKLAWSSGSVTRLIRRDAASGKIVRWPIVEASLTPTPCEPRLAPVMSLKSLTDADGGRGDAGASRRRLRLVEIELELLRLNDLEG